MNRNIPIWTRGVDREQFNPGRRDMEWRRDLGIADDELVVVFLGRLVMEKGLDVFADALDALDRARRPAPRAGHRRRPGAGWFEERLPDAVFVGQQVGDDLARALASGDVFLNPSVTEAFGNVTLEAMACAVPVVAADATGATSLVRDGETGMLVDPGDVEALPTRSRPMPAIPSCASATAPPAWPSPRRWTGTRSTPRVLDVYRGSIEQARAAGADDRAARLISPVRSAARLRRGSRRSRAAARRRTRRGRRGG